MLLSGRFLKRKFSFVKFSTSSSSHLNFLSTNPKNSCTYISTVTSKSSVPRIQIHHYRRTDRLFDGIQTGGIYLNIWSFLINRNILFHLLITFSDEETLNLLLDASSRLNSHLKSQQLFEIDTLIHATSLIGPLHYTNNLMNWTSKKGASCSNQSVSVIWW